jgi:hypothetical protein
MKMDPVVRRKFFKTRISLAMSGTCIGEQPSSGRPKRRRQPCVADLKGRDVGQSVSDAIEEIQACENRFISEGSRLFAERAESREAAAQEAYEQQPRSLWIGGHGTDP